MIGLENKSRPVRFDRLKRVEIDRSAKRFRERVGSVVLARGDFSQRGQVDFAAERRGSVNSRPKASRVDRGEIGKTELCPFVCRREDYSFIVVAGAGGIVFDSVERKLRAF